MLVNTVVSRIKHGRHLFKTDSLFRNATYLTASTLITSLLGFVFWIFVAHLYTPAQIGLASALISVATLISNLSLLGLNAGIVRFLPSAKNQSSDINAATIVVGGTTLVAAAAYAFIGTHISGHIGILASTGSKLAFTALMAAVSLNSVTDAVFIARRRGEYHTAGYTTIGVVKLILPLFLVPFGATGVFGAFVLAVLASLALSYYLMWRGCDYRFFTKPNWAIIKQTRAYAAHNYVGSVLGGLPSQLMPLFLIRSIGSSSVAYFSMSWTMANLLYVVPSAAMQSTLAEVSNNPEKRHELVKRSIRMLTLILIPTILLATVIAPYMLGIFGAQYRQHATIIFQLFALNTICVAVSTVGNTLLNIARKTRGVVWAQVANLLVTFGSAAWFVRYGLQGIGFAMLLGNLAASLVYIVLVRVLKRRGDDTAASAPFTATKQTVATLVKPYGIRTFTFKELTNGSRNTTLLITHKATKYVLRVYRDRDISDAKIEEEIAFTSYLTSQGLLVPEIVANKAGDKLSKAVIDDYTHRYILMDYAPGTHPKRYSLPILSGMATQQARIHLGGIQYAKDTKRVFSPLPFGFSHFDFDATNILADGDQLSSVIDFEGMRYGPLVICMYFTLQQVYELEQDIALPLAYLRLYQDTRKLHFLEKSLLAVLLSLRFRNIRFLRVLAV